MRLGIAVLVLVALAGCGGDDGGPQGPVGPGEALVMTGQTVTVRGFLVQEPGVRIPRICAALGESYPPRCGSPSLPVERFRKGSVRFTRDPETGGRWTEREIELRGVVRDGALILS